LKLLVWLLKETGMRIQEAFSLRKDRLNYTEYLVRIEALYDPETGFDFVPKTIHSQREIPVTEALMAALREEAEKDPARIFSAGVRHEYAHWRHRLRKLCSKHGVRPIQFSEFRDSRSAVLMDANVPLPAYQALMGHSASTALKHYAVASRDEIRKAFKKVQEEELRQCDTGNGGDKCS
jgi:integrase